MQYLSLLLFLDKGFKFQPNVCNGCHDLLIMSMKVSDIDVLNIVKDFDHHFIISRICKNRAINLMQNTYLTERRRTLWNIKVYSHV